MVHEKSLPPEKDEDTGLDNAGQKSDSASQELDSLGEALDRYFQATEKYKEKQAAANRAKAEMAAAYRRIYELRRERVCGQMQLPGMR